MRLRHGGTASFVRVPPKGVAPARVRIAGVGEACDCRDCIHPPRLRERAGARFAFGLRVMKSFSNPGDSHARPAHRRPLAARRRRGGRAAGAGGIDVGRAGDATRRAAGGDGGAAGADAAGCRPEPVGSSEFGGRGERGACRIWYVLGCVI